MRTKLFTPKSCNRCHFWAVLGPIGEIVSFSNMQACFLEHFKMVTSKQRCFAGLMATAIWNIVHCHPHALNIKVNNHQVNNQVDYFLFWTTFCNIKFFKYLSLGIFSLGWYCSFLLIKPSESLAFHLVEALVLYLFFHFQGSWTCKRSNNTHVNFYFSDPFAFLKSFIKYPFVFLESFWISVILFLRISARLKVTRVFCILNSNHID